MERYLHKTHEPGLKGNKGSTMRKVMEVCVQAWIGYVQEWMVGVQEWMVCVHRMAGLCARLTRMLARWHPIFCNNGFFAVIAIWHISTRAI